MRKPSENSVATKVRKRIERGGDDRLWTYSDFRGLPPLAVAAALSRSTRGPKPLIRRVRKGVYYFPKNTRFGETRPDTARVAAHLLNRRGIAWAPTGTTAYNGLGLTTQVSPKITFRVNRPVRSVDWGEGTKIRLRPSYAVEGLESSELTALDALKDLRRIPDSTPADTVRRVSDLVVSGRLSFNRLARLAEHDSPRARALVGVIGSRIGANPKLVAKLKKSLNPLTTFRLNVGGSIPTAGEWHIR